MTAAGERQSGFILFHETIIVSVKSGLMSVKKDTSEPPAGGTGKISCNGLSTGARAPPAVISRRIPVRVRSNARIEYKDRRLPW
jgi:hypothetical protein